MSVLRTEKLPGRSRNRPIMDYSGRRFARLVAIELVERRDVGSIWRFRCDCGSEKVANIIHVRCGSVGSCGCLARDLLVSRNSTHGLSRKHPREYKTWKCMRARCSNPQNGDYADYGGRGIRVCERWSDFAAFFADMGARPDGASLDRINVDGGYDPANCRWETPTTQANNKRSNHTIAFRGEERTLAQWCRIFGVEASKVRYRLKQGWSLDDAFSGNDFRRPKA